MKVTGDEQGVRYLKQMYMQEKQEAMMYLAGSKKRGAVFFRALKGNHYFLYEIRYSEGEVYNVTLFQEGSLTDPS